MARRTRWFATSVVDPELLGDPTWVGRSEAAVVHAKEVGTVVTACGRHATTWHKHWTPFDSSPAGNRCTSCSAVVEEEAQRARWAGSGC